MTGETQTHRARALLVLGMHRSGTSAVARLLSLCGAALPRDTWAPDADNEAGYWEPAPVVALHDELLSAFGSGFDDVGALPPGWHRSELASVYARRLQAILRAEYGEAPLWTIKDPRLCRLVPLWRDVLGQLDVVPAAILVVRNPLEVAGSLATRDGFSPAKSLLLWLRHFLDAEVTTRDMPRAFVTYDSLFEDWRGVVDRVGREIDLQWPRPMEAAAPEVDRFLDSNRRHHAVSRDDVAGRGDVAHWLWTVYRWAVQAAGGAPASATTLDRVRRELATADRAYLPLLDDWQRDRLRLAEASGELSERDRRIERLTTASARAVAEADHLRGQVLRLQHQLDLIEASASRWLAAPIRWLERSGGVFARVLGAFSRASSWETRGRLRNPLRLRREARLVRESELFDHGWYLDRNPDVAASGLDPVVHFLCHGAAEGRDPGPRFRTRWYAGQNPEAARRRLNPLVHYLRVGREARRPTQPPDAVGAPGEEGSEVRSRELEALVRQVLASPVAVDPVHAGFQTHAPIPTGIRAVAFYLPQFHPVPENDEWWGRGFTEWTNVSRAVPQFLGHYQPRLPGELGFYDLRLPEIQRRQVELARNYGVHAFCFHYYWFAGRRLLERPLDQFRADPSLDLSFCVCWANENWTRRWDGSEKDVLIAQRHSPEDDRALIREISTLFEDPRYLRVEGRPIVVVYRAGILPEAAATAERWRSLCRESGQGEILLVAAQTFGAHDPRDFGFDAAVEFPPHGAPMRSLEARVAGLNPSFRGSVASYEALADHFKRRGPVPYPLFRTVCPSWDNTPRTLERGHVYHGSSPGSYREWLQTACRYAEEHPIHGERLVFINAWNEWAEGACLEPDRRFGYAYLEATRSALANLAGSPAEPAG